jgi:hypothetical protein
MKIISRIGLYGVLFIISSSLIGYLIESVSSSSILFMDEILTHDFQKKVLSNSRWVLIVLLIINIYSYIKAQNHAFIQNEQLLYNNICNKIFNDYIKSNPSLSNNDFKVSLLKAHEPWFGTTYLKVVGRFQTKQKNRKSKLEFRPGEGCVGIAFENGYILHKEIEKYNFKKITKYYSESEKVLNLPKRKAEKLNEKACAFLCLPVKYYNTDKVWGVLSVDCLESGKLKTIDPRAIEETLLHYSTFFNHNLN